MTKEKLRRLIQLTAWENDDQMHSAAEEYRDELTALRAEFEAWQPEAATANGQSARYWMNLAEQYAEECITLRHKART